MDSATTIEFDTYPFFTAAVTASVTTFRQPFSRSLAFVLNFLHLQTGTALVINGAWRSTKKRAGNIAICVRNLRSHALYINDNLLERIMGKSRKVQLPRKKGAVEPPLADCLSAIHTPQIWSSFPAMCKDQCRKWLKPCDPNGERWQTKVQHQWVGSFPRLFIYICLVVDSALFMR